jgi:hypothetical protein
MEKTKTIFLPSDNADKDFELQCYVNQFNEIYMTIYNKNDEFMFGFISLDLKTAIKFSKHLRKEIAKVIQESEVNND